VNENLYDDYLLYLLVFWRFTW